MFFLFWNVYWVWNWFVGVARWGDLMALVGWFYRRVVLFICERFTMIWLIMGRKQVLFCIISVCFLSIFLVYTCFYAFREVFVVFV